MALQTARSALLIVGSPNEAQSLGNLCGESRVPFIRCAACRLDVRTGAGARYHSGEMNGSVYSKLRWDLSLIQSA
jgi:hypothetical protein